jgi:hypothetical protein
MPLYNWKCSKCDTTAEVLRSFDDYQVPPGLEDDRLEDSDCDHEWERRIGSDIQVQRGPNWGGGKGNWIALLTVGADLITRYGGNW